jgi:hypothetical protein
MLEGKIAIPMAVMKVTFLLIIIENLPNNFFSKCYFLGYWVHDPTFGDHIAHLIPKILVEKNYESLNLFFMDNEMFM